MLAELVPERLIINAHADEAAVQFNANPILLAEPAPMPACFVETISESYVSEAEPCGDCLGPIELPRRDKKIDVTVRAALALPIEPASD